MPTEIELVPAAVEDLVAVAEIHLASRHAAAHAFPRAAHTDEEIRSWVTGWDLASAEVWLAKVDAQAVGYARWTSTWLDDLYVAPQAQGHGVGESLLGLVKSHLPGGFGLWVFESNHPASHFYRRHGFVRLERTDGAGNEEHAPDIKLVWPGRDPLACFRTMIDEVDLTLGDVLARRTALTRVVQEHKHAGGSVSHPVRDPAREDEIVQRIAALAPELEEEQVARIVQVIISEALLAYRRSSA